ncbi:MAG: hypothetical protein PHD43_23335 [Methylococcales bacterium]|nr:hypothetical protein [Candidatus Paceibacterota bacterium]MDD5323482.1 hypothetical protein [Methylococcales bacterium]
MTKQTSKKDERKELRNEKIIYNGLIKCLLSTSILLGIFFITGFNVWKNMFLALLFLLAFKILDIQIK